MKLNHLSLALVASLLSAQAYGVSISLNYDLADFQGTNGQSALNGFEEAASFWESVLADDIEVSVNIGFDALGGSIVGQAASTLALLPYSATGLALMSDITSDADLLAANNLVCEDQNAGACTFSFLEEEYNSGTGTLETERDNDGSANNAQLRMTQANAKALGFTGDLQGAFGTDADATITFNSGFAFDYDRADGITSGTMDFVGVAIHELGHSLGFVSGVDIYDFYHYDQNPATTPFDLDSFALASTLDLFRYSSESLAQGVGVKDLRAGADTYFSLDGGVTALAPFSTGVAGGDGQQASHWKDNLDLGILDPTVSFGELLQVSELDLLAFDAIGFDLRAVPAPGVFLLPLTALLLLRTRRIKQYR